MLSTHQTFRLFFHSHFLVNVLVCSLPSCCIASSQDFLWHRTQLFLNLLVSHIEHKNVIQTTNAVLSDCRSHILLPIYFARSRIYVKTPLDFAFGTEMCGGRGFCFDVILTPAIQCWRITFNCISEVFI